jgi:transcriptional regulator with XRE-family HTH domain
MQQTARRIIGNNVGTLREALGLSQIKFAIVVGISRASLINIESGKTGYNLNLLDNILTFAHYYSIGDISKEAFVVRNDFREKLINIYKDNSTVNVILSGVPTIVYAVQYKLLKGKFLEVPKEINEIRLFFNKFGWYFKGPSIQNTLRRMDKYILIQPHPIKKNTNIYSKISNFEMEGKD